MFGRQVWRIKMPYATRADIEDRRGTEFLEIIADRDDDGTPEDAAIDAALADASALIDSYLAKRYDLPFTVAPDLLVPLAVDIAIHYLADRLSVGTKENRKRYEDAVTTLRALADGKMNLAVDPAATVIDKPLVENQTDQQFGGGQLRRWGSRNPVR
jgi:phage gp36-like protein